MSTEKQAAENWELVEHYMTTLRRLLDLHHKVQRTGGMLINIGDQIIAHPANVLSEHPGLDGIDGAEIHRLLNHFVETVRRGCKASRATSGPWGPLQNSRR